MTTRMQIAIEDPGAPDVRELLEEHLRDMRMHSPPESVHALEVGKLQHPDITFWTAREGALLLGCGALRQLDPAHGEIKSMRTPTALRRQGVGRALLAHIIEVARGRAYERLSLETGSMDVFLPAQRLYQRYGFSYCEPFGDYKPDPNSVFMTLRL